MSHICIFIFSIILASALTFSSSNTEAGTGVLLTDGQLGHVFGGEANICGPTIRETCAQPQIEGPLSEIILWDEWGRQSGTPRYSAPGSSWSMGEGKTGFQSNVIIMN